MAAAPWTLVLALLFAGRWPPGRAAAAGAPPPDSDGRCVRAGDTVAQLRCELEESRAVIEEQHALILALQASVGEAKTAPTEGAGTTRLGAGSAAAEAPGRHPGSGRARASRPSKDPRRTYASHHRWLPPDNGEDGPDGWLPDGDDRPEATEEAAAALPQPRRVQGGGGGDGDRRCVDSPVGWRDVRGDDCHMYVQAGFCTPAGRKGPSWAAKTGTFQQWTAQGQTAVTACCGCGGGEVCQDSPVGWVDAQGNDCATYASRGWCSGDGGPGAGWQQAWGTFMDRANAGHTAATACCACMPRAKDAGGRGCGYYAQNPTHCGCCDDEDFVAQVACASVCSPRPLPGSRELADAIAGWPNATRHIIFPRGTLGGRLAVEDWQTRFPQLQTLYLRSFNQPVRYLQGTLPSELGGLRGLRYIDLRYSKLTGTLPTQRGQLDLVVLQLTGNAIEGSLPSWLGNLTELVMLTLASNRLRGSLPHVLGRLRKLVGLDVSGNRLAGTLPKELGQLAQLSRLYAYSNSFTGTLPRELGDLTQLKEFYGYNNGFTGTVPSTLGNLTKMEWFYMSANFFTGTLPTELSKLTSLIALDLSGNMLTGTLPPEFGSLAALQTLTLSSNNLTGALPSELGQLANLQVLDLSSNGFSGTLPSEWGNLAQLYFLGINSNKITGALPREVGEMAQLYYFSCQHNRLTGTLPAELGLLTDTLETLDVRDNQLTGPVPAELGSLQWLTVLRLSANDFTELPPELGQLEALTDLDVMQNPRLSGTFPDTTGCPSLLRISASGCNFSAAGAVGGNVDTLSFANNSFTSLPPAWEALPNVTKLDLSGNQIAAWSPYGVLPLGTFYGVGDYQCGMKPLADRLRWPVIEQVDLSGNPLGRSTTARDFIWSLGYLRRLADLRAARCGLQGVVPLEGPFFAEDMVNTGDSSCQGVPANRSGFPSLFSLDLSGNELTAVLAPPPERLSLATLHGNRLNGTALHPAWYAVSGSLEVWGNPLLRASVAPPEGRDGCPSAGAPALRANPYGWSSPDPGDAFQCTTLCAGLRTRYKHDTWLNVSSLCHCTPGRQGSGMDCTGCPADTFSDQVDEWGTVRTCRRCPVPSTTDEGVENATSVEDCKCPPGWYMGTADDGNTSTAPGQACLPCRQRGVQTTVRGATQADQCVCNPAYSGLRALQGTCGCPDGQHMDYVAMACRKCDTAAELCTWGAHVEDSLLPPIVKASYWAAPTPNASGDKLSNFSRNEIWRCLSKSTCKQGGVCASGRRGLACSLCEDGMYGGPDGECKPCPSSPEKSRQSLLLGLLIGPGVTMAAHFMLQGEDGRREAMQKLSSLKTSVKQCLKYLQMLGVMSIFSVNWPPLARKFLTDISQITVAFPQVAGPSCLTGYQTAVIEVGFRLALPMAGLLSACLAAVILLPLRAVSKGRRWYRYVRMGFWDVVRVSLWGLVLFYSTMLQFGTQILTCAPSPNGVSTVQTFPHLQCRADKEWVGLACVSVAFLIIFMLAFFIAIHTAWRLTMVTLVESHFRSRGWWGFLFEDFRMPRSHWVMLTMTKDMLLVTIATAGVGDGSAQLMATAAGATFYSYIVLRDQPFNDQANNFLEAWTAMSLAVLSVFSAGMGYQSTPEVDDVAELYAGGEEDVVYKSRARAMLAVQWTTLAGPVLIVMYQLLTFFERVRKRLPRFLRPMEEDERQDWNDNFLARCGLVEENAFCGVVRNLDPVESASFRALMGNTVATLGIVDPVPGGIQGAGRRWMHKVASRSTSFRSASTNQSNRSRSRISIGSPGTSRDLPAVEGGGLPESPAACAGGQVTPSNKVLGSPSPSNASPRSMSQDVDIEVLDQVVVLTSLLGSLPPPPGDPSGDGPALAAGEDNVPPLQEPAARPTQWDKAGGVKAMEAQEGRVVML